MTKDEGNTLAVLVIMVVAVFLGSSILLGGCNRQVFDLELTFDVAYVRWPDGRSETIAIRKWRDYEDGDQIQIVAEDGNTYLFHSANIVLARRRRMEAEK